MNAFHRYLLLCSFAVLSLLSSRAADETVSGNLTVTGDATTQGNLAVQGTTDLEGNSLSIGTQSGGHGLGIHYGTSGTEAVTFEALRSADWLWGLNLSAPLVEQMRLDATNNLTLYSGGVAGVVLNPSANSLSLGSAVLYRDSNGDLKTDGQLLGSNLSGTNTGDQTRADLGLDTSDSVTLSDLSLFSATPELSLTDTGTDQSVIKLGATGNSAYESIIGNDVDSNRAFFIRQGGTDIFSSRSSGGYKGITIGSGSSTVKIMRNPTAKVEVTSTTESTSPTTGALTVAGGLGVGKNVSIGGNLLTDGSLGIGTGSPDTLLHIEKLNSIYTDHETVITASTSGGGGEQAFGVAVTGDALRTKFGSNFRYIDNSFSQENPSRSSGYFDILNLTTAGKTSQLAYIGVTPGSATPTTLFEINNDGDASFAGSISASDVFLDGESVVVSSDLGGYVPLVGASQITGSSTGLTLASGGIDQNVTISPSGAGGTQIIGRLGVGTDSPSTELDIVGDGRLSGDLDIGGDLILEGNVVESSKIAAVAKITPVYIRGSGSNIPNSRRVVVGDYSDSVGSRGLRLLVFTASTHDIVSAETFDTYGSNQRADDLAVALRGLTRTQIGVLTSHDAFASKITANLREAASELGLFRLAAARTVGDFSDARMPYAALFQGGGTPSASGSPVAKAVEVLNDSGSNDGDAIIVSAFYENGFIGQNLTNALISGDPADSIPGVFVDFYNRVGINTITPSRKLDVAGEIKFGANAESTWGYGLLSSESGWNGKDYPTLGSVGGTSGSLAMVHNLHLPFRTDNKRSSKSGKAAVRMAASASASANWDAGLGGDYYYIDRSVSGNDTEFLRITNGGNVGIGTSAPTEKLDVAGSVKVADEIVVNGTGNSVVKGPLLLVPQGDLPMGVFTDGTNPATL
ncbi:MAG: hypothetical protein SynsKO_21640 [Synoicihabitans sp.]